MIQERIGLKLKFRTNLAAHLRWLSFLISTKFIQDIKRRYEVTANVNRLQAQVRKVVEEEIYSHSSYQGSGAIKQSVQGQIGTNDDNNVASIGIYFDPGVATAKGPVESGTPSQFNYAAFFERPEFNSFILGSGLDVFNSIKHRPFIEPAEQAVKEQFDIDSVRAILSSIRGKRPRQSQSQGQ